MAVLDVEVVSEASDVVTFTNCAGGGDKAHPGDGVIVLFRNGHASADYVVTVNDPTSDSPEGAAAFNPDAQFTVVHGTTVGLRLDARFANPADSGLASWTYGATPTTMAAAVVRA